MAECYYILACVVCGKLFDATGRNAITCSGSSSTLFIAPVHITSSLLCEEQKVHNPAREAVLGNHRLQSQQSRLELGLCISELLC
jgi:hypothetical protein